MRHIAVALFVAVSLVVLTPSTGTSVAGGVPPGTPVHMHTHPDNGIVTAVRIAATRVGLGPVEAVGFEPNCSPMPRWVLVCRDPTLDRRRQATATTVGAGWCVVRLEPTLGPGPSSLRLVIAALRQCLG